MNDDMIRRQVALNTVEHMYKACEGSLEDYHDLLVAAFMDLTPAHGDEDVISRRAAISKKIPAVISGQGTEVVLVSELKQLPPVQPEITLESAIKYLHSIGWMQNHDRIITEDAWRKGVMRMPLPKWEGEKDNDK